MAVIVRELPPSDARRQGRTMYASGKVRGGFRVMYIGRDKVGTNTSTGKHKHKNHENATCNQGSDSRRAAPAKKKTSNVTAQLCGSIRVRDRRYQKLVSARNFDHEIC